MALSDADVAKALSAPDVSTKDFIFQQTMLRIKDPKVSLDFYSRVLGMRCVVIGCIHNKNTFFCLNVIYWFFFRMLANYHFPDMKFSLYFMGYEKEEDIPKDTVERTKWAFMRKATLELTQ